MKLSDMTRQRAECSACHRVEDYAGPEIRWHERNGWIRNGEHRMCPACAAKTPKD